MLSKEELLIPRYIVIDDYPGSIFKIGTIITLDNLKLPKWYHPDFNYKEQRFFNYIEDFNKYPKIFKKLFWYENRSEKDLPKYISVANYFYKVKKYISNVAYLENYYKEYELGYYIKPATEEEFNNDKQL